LAQVRDLAERALAFWAEEVPCLLVARRLAWDSELLGIEAGMLDYLLFPDTASDDALAAALAALGRLLRTRGWRLLLHKSSTADPRAVTAIGRAGFDLLAVHLDHLLPTTTVAARRAPPVGYAFAPARPGDESALATLSAENHAPFDRFRIDPLVPQERVPALYAEWARNSLRGYADVVWAARRAGRPVGFATFGLRAGLTAATGVHCVEYQLGAVDAAERGRGVFGALTAAVLRHLAGRGEPLVSAATNVLNVPAQRVFQALGGWVHAPVLTHRLDLAR
jgi:GNAT superfamily N-acetyltransferase